MAYLLDNPPRQRQFRRTRRAKPSGVLVAHTGESATSADGLALARFIQGRADYGSYHNIAGHRSWLRLVPYDAEAFGDGTGSNSHAIHVSFATKAALWPSMSTSVRQGFVEQGALAAADAAEWLYRTTGVVVPARRITRAESERRVPGFISHGERDPARRTDPGRGFPWDAFLARYAQLTAALGNAPEGDDDMTPEQSKKLDAVELRSIAILQRIEALEANVPPNLAEEIDEIRRNLRSVGDAVGAETER